ncbi:hypothetical protein TWF281_010461 [Arthrobotrys megalospora]
MKGGIATKLDISHVPQTWAEYRSRNNSTCFDGDSLDCLDPSLRDQDSTKSFQFKDDLDLGEIFIKNATFKTPVSYEDSASGYENKPVLGLGISTGNSPPSVLQTMVSQNITNTPSFSIFLGSLLAESGLDKTRSIVFGGVDLSKFQRPLITFPAEGQYEGKPKLPLHRMDLTLQDNSSLPIKSEPGSARLDFREP